MFSGAGGVLAHRRRNLSVSPVQPAHRLSNFKASSSFLVNIFPFLKPSRTFSTSKPLKPTLIEPPNYRYEILYTGGYSYHQANAYGEILLKDTISLNGMAMLLWFSSTASHLDQNHQTLPLPTPEMHVSPHNLSPSPYSGRRPKDLHLPAKRKLGQLVDFFMSGPLRSQKPKFKKGDPNPSLQKPRSAPNYSLYILNQFLKFLSAPLDRGRQMNRKFSVLLWMFKNYLQTLPLDSPRFFDPETNCLKKKGILFSSPISRWCDFCHQSSINCLSPTHLNTNFKQSPININVKTQSSRDYKENFRIYVGNPEPSSHALDSKRWKKNGIMVPSPRSGDYRHFFYLFHSFPLFTEIKQVRFNNFKVSIQESESLRKNGIMIPSPWSGGYRSFLNLLSPLPPDYRTKVNHLLADEQLQLAFLAPARTSVMEPSSTSSRLLTVTTSSSFDSLEKDHSTSRDLTCVKTLNCFCLKALMDYLSFSPYLSCYGIGECLLYLCFKLCDLCITPLVLGLI